MKSTRNRLRVFYFGLLLTTAIAFVVASLWLILKVNHKRDKVEQFVTQIDVISDLELSVMECLDLYEGEKEEKFQKAIQELTNRDFQLDQFPELTNLSKKTRDLKVYFGDSGVQMDFIPFRQDLQDLYFTAIEEKKENRKTLGLLSVELSNYWNYTHLLIVLACGLSLILLAVAVVFFRSKRKLENLQFKNSMFLNSVTDCVIVCSNEGTIIEFNETSVETFGYSKEELENEPITNLYVEREDWEKVSDALKYTGFFKGEIINRKKNGNRFISFLSANIIYDENGNRLGSMGISRDITTQKQSEEQFQHIVDNATDIIYTTNVNGEITYINGSGNSALGYTNEDFIGMSFHQLIHPDFLEDVISHYAEQFKGKKEQTYLECKMLKSNGEAIWIGQNVRTTFSPTDPQKILGFFGILRNLDEIKKVQIELLESETKYRELFDNSKDLIQSTDANGGILYVNDAWKKTLGYTDEVISQLNLFDIIHQESRDYCEELLSDILKYGSHHDEREHFFRLVTAEGTSVLLKGTLSVKYEQGQVKSLQTFLRDVTEHHEIEQALKKSEENFRLISDSINDVFFLYDSVVNKYQYISPNCEDVLGAKPEFFYSGKNYTNEFIHPDDVHLLEEMNNSVRLGTASHLEYRRVIDGKIKWIDEKWFPIKNNDGDTICISGICRDITDMKEAYDTIYEQNQEISQSILYAKNIQESTLPTDDEVKSILPDSFVFYKAKDILSGDLYIVDYVYTNEGDKWPAFIVGDCTGHGVPGSLLSLLCNGLLTESLTSSKISSPAEALDFVRDKLIRLFRSNPSKYILDGMDAAFCVLDRDSMELSFAGANLSCFIVRSGEVYEYRGDKQPIGYGSKMADFVNFTIDVEEGDALYLTTDGYVDQFGGIKNKKFLKKRFTELLLKIEALSMVEQQARIKEEFMTWKGDTEQTDDIAMIGVKI